MDQNHLGVAFQLLQQFFYFYIVLQEERDHESRRLNFESSASQFDADNNEEDLIALLSTFHPQTRRNWMEVRSTHWIRHILSGVLLQGQQFEDFFRISRNSFEHLHALLGISEPDQG